MEIKFSDITVVVQGAVYEGITVRAVESVRRFRIRADLPMPNVRERKSTTLTARLPIRQRG